MSHDLRTQLNAILGYTRLMELRGPASTPQRRDLEWIRRGAEHLLTLINDILQFAKTEAGRLQFRVEEVRPAPFLIELEALISPQVDAKGLQYGCEVRSEEMAVLAPSCSGEVNRAAHCVTGKPDEPIPRVIPRERTASRPRRQRSRPRPRRVEGRRVRR